ncbi:uncharacterized protein LOC131949993 [Physella acuta]|uniref:uncharacterized protein LOC131949993 n=1 Tax=Physella acuta TaxID=109671 RepID=UPI0027DB6CC1|nr:uncharacterized protein LOC131949993 [Physella acuta]
MLRILVANILHSRQQLHFCKTLKNLYPRITLKPNNRTLSFKSKQTFRPKHDKDKVPKEFIIVYENSQKSIIAPSRIISTGFCFISFGMALNTVLNHQEGGDKTELYISLIACIMSLSIVVFVNVISRFYLTRIYFSKDNNTFIGISNNFWGLRKQIKYSKEDIKPVWFSSLKGQQYAKKNVRIHGRTFHLRANDFTVPKYFNMHIGQV